MKEIKLKYFWGFYCTKDGDVYKVYDNSIAGTVMDRVTVYKPKNKAPFVRLFRDGKSFSLTIAKAILLAFNPKGYKDGLIAVHLKGKADTLENLKWGTREEQSLIHVEDEKNWKRISALGKKHGHKNGKVNGKKYGKYNLTPFRNAFSKKTIRKIKKLLKKEKTPTQISNKLGIGRSSIYKYMN